MNLNTGGPAFPLAASTGDPRDGVYCQNGMTLLDYMAGQALAGICSSWYDRHKDDPETQRGHGPVLISQSAYTHAEAMLAEKARREAVVRPATSLDVVAHERSQALDRVIELEAANRELVEALRSCDAAFSKFAPQEESAYGMAWVNVRAAITKAKEVA